MRFKVSPEIDRPFLIIGSNSAGSTLLSILLDRHPMLACGPELSVFNKRAIYDSFGKLQRMLPFWLGRGLSTDGQSEYREFFFNLEAYFWSREDLIALARHVSNLRDFFDQFFINYLQKRGKAVWGEKTGSNSYCISQFLEIYPRARIIHIVRDGRDTVCSLLCRPDTNAYHCVAHWLYDVSSALACRTLDGYLEVRYEDLVSQPRNAMERICRHLGVDFDPGIINGENDKYWMKFSEGNVHKSWRRSPFSGAISRTSVGRYRRDMSRDVENLFWKVGLTPVGRKRAGINWGNTLQVMGELDYVWEVPNLSESVGIKHYSELIKEECRRFKRELLLERRPWLPLTWIRL